MICKIDFFLIISNLLDFYLNSQNIIVKAETHQAQKKSRTHYVMGLEDAVAATPIKPSPCISLEKQVPQLKPGK